jgi:hypothetical protein
MAQLLCSTDECVEEAVASAEERALCRKHFLSYSYKRLEDISGRIHEAQFHERHSDAASHFLEDCMRDAADIACGADTPSNLERAQVLDVLLWASELHGRLRRGPRVPARLTIQLRSENPDKPWEEKTETQLISRHGAQVTCGHDVSTSDKLTCVRLDNGWRTEARVAWTSRKASGRLEVGLEFLTDKNFWGLGGGSSISHTIPEGRFDSSRRGQLNPKNSVNS